MSLLFLLLGLNFLVTLVSGSGYRLTYDRYDDSITTSCHPEVSRFHKGVRCCYSSANNGIIDSCTPYNPNDGVTCLTNGADLGYDLLWYNFTESAEICSSFGYELCSYSDYLSYCLGTGCGVDWLEAWTTTECTPYYQSYHCDDDTLLVREPSNIGGIRCCTLLGDGSTDAICSPTDSDTNVCYYNGNVKTNKTDYINATRICENDGRRLCDIGPVSSDDGVVSTTHYGCCGSGCWYNTLNVWSRTIGYYNITPANTYTSCGEMYKDLQSLEGLSDGYYLLGNLDNVQTYCAFINIDSSTIYIFTLFESFSLANNADFDYGFAYENLFFNEYQLAGNGGTKYRLRKNHLFEIYGVESLILSTCNFDLTLTTDHLLMLAYSAFFDTTSDSEYYTTISVDIRGYSSTNCDVRVWSYVDAYHVHVDSSLNSCGSMSTGAASSEDNFGFYHSANAAFSCTASTSSTTQWWLGSEYYILGKTEALGTATTWTDTATCDLTNTQYENYDQIRYNNGADEGHTYCLYGPFDTYNTWFTKEFNTSYSGYDLTIRVQCRMWMICSFDTNEQISLGIIDIQNNVTYDNLWTGSPNDAFSSYSMDGSGWYNIDSCWNTWPYTRYFDIDVSLTITSNHFSLKFGGVLSSPIYDESWAVSDISLELTHSTPSPTADWCIPHHSGALKAWFRGDSFDDVNNIWYDKTGNGWDASTIRGDPYLVNVTFNNSLRYSEYPVIEGYINDGIQFQANMFEYPYTLFHLIRWHPDGDTKERIVQGSPENWLEGQHSTSHSHLETAIAYHGTWITAKLNPYNTSWVLSSSQLSLYRGNGKQTSYNNTPGLNVPTYLGVNYGAQTDQYTNGWQASEIIVYDGELSLSEIKEVEIYFNTVYGISNDIDTDEANYDECYESCNSESPTKHPTSNPTADWCIPHHGGSLSAWFRGDSYDDTNNIWYDKTGNGWDASTIRGDPYLVNQTFNNSLRYSEYPVLEGYIDDGLQFQANMFVYPYTLFLLTRWHPDGDNRQRIIQGYPDNWLEGHHNHDGIWDTGVSYHGRWITPVVDNHGTYWVLSSSQLSLYRSNGIQRSTTYGWNTTTYMGINYGTYSSQYTNGWQVAEVIVYNKELTTTEIEEVEIYLNTVYGISDDISTDATNYDSCYVSYNSPSPTDAPTIAPSDAPSISPSMVPSISPSDPPTKSPTNVPSNSPTNSPTITPTNSPTNTPTNAPSNTPTDIPSNTPTNVPSKSPTNSPTNTPSNSPSNSPTKTPSNSPTNTPSKTPSDSPTNNPTNVPTNTPTDTPTNSPSDSPTNSPSNSPANIPSASPTNTPSNSPSNSPTKSPSNSPTNTPSNSPSNTPTNSPSNSPTNTPSNSPTNTPSNTPTDSPTNTPTNSPSNTPTNSPSNSPTDTPSNSPTNVPSNSPSNSPTNSPSNSPTNSPTNMPTNAPTNPPTVSPTDEPSALRISFTSSTDSNNRYFNPNSRFTITLTGKFVNKWAPNVTSNITWFCIGCSGDYVTLENSDDQISVYESRIRNNTHPKIVKFKSLLTLNTDGWSGSSRLTTKVCENGTIFSDGETYVIGATMTVWLDGDRLMGNKTKVLTVYANSRSSIPDNLCNIYPRHGTSLKTKFEFTCNDSLATQELSYNFYKEGVFMTDYKTIGDGLNHENDTFLTVLGTGNHSITGVILDENDYGTCVDLGRVSAVLEVANASELLSLVDDFVSAINLTEVNPTDLVTSQLSVLDTMSDYTSNSNVSVEDVSDMVDVQESLLTNIDTVVTTSANISTESLLTVAGSLSSLTTPMVDNEVVEIVDLYINGNCTMTIDPFSGNYSTGDIEEYILDAIIETTDYSEDYLTVDILTYDDTIEILFYIEYSGNIDSTLNDSNVSINVDYASYEVWMDSDVLLNALEELNSEIFNSNSDISDCSLNLIESHSSSSYYSSSYASDVADIVVNVVDTLTDSLVDSNAALDGNTAIGLVSSVNNLINIRSGLGDSDEHASESGDSSVGVLSTVGQLVLVDSEVGENKVISSGNTTVGASRFEKDALDEACPEEAASIELSSAYVDTLGSESADCVVSKQLDNAYDPSGASNDSFNSYFINLDADAPIANTERRMRRLNMLRNGRRRLSSDYINDSCSPILITIPNTDVIGWNTTYPECKFWNTTTESYGGEGCYVLTKNENESVCACLHATYFGVGSSDLAVSVNPITLSAFADFTWNSFKSHPAGILVSGCIVIICLWMMKFLPKKDDKPLLAHHNVIHKKYLESDAVNAYRVISDRKILDDNIRTIWWKATELWKNTIKNEHEIFSICFRDKGTGYTGRQRIAMLLVKLMTMIAVNGLFYGNEQSGPGGDFMVSLYGSILSAPPTVLEKIFQKYHMKERDRHGRSVRHGAKKRKKIQNKENLINVRTKDMNYMIQDIEMGNNNNVSPSQESQLIPKPMKSNKNKLNLKNKISNSLLKPSLDPDMQSLVLNDLLAQTIKEEEEEKEIDNNNENIRLTVPQLNSAVHSEILNDILDQTMEEDNSSEEQSEHSLQISEEDSIEELEKRDKFNSNINRMTVFKKKQRPKVDSFFGKNSLQIPKSNMGHHASYDTMEFNDDMYSKLNGSQNSNTPEHSVSDSHSFVDVGYDGTDNRHSMNLSHNLNNAFQNALDLNLKKHESNLSPEEARMRAWNEMNREEEKELHKLEQIRLKKEERKRLEEEKKQLEQMENDDLFIPKLKTKNPKLKQNEISNFDDLLIDTVQNLANEEVRINLGFSDSVQVKDLIVVDEHGNQKLELDNTHYESDSEDEFDDEVEVGVWIGCKAIVSECIDSWTCLCCKKCCIKLGCKKDLEDDPSNEKVTIQTLIHYIQTNSIPYNDKTIHKELHMTHLLRTRNDDVLNDALAFTFDEVKKLDNEKIGDTRPLTQEEKVKILKYLRSQVLKKNRVCPYWFKYVAWVFIFFWTLGCSFMALYWAIQFDAALDAANDTPTSQCPNGYDISELDRLAFNKTALNLTAWLANTPTAAFEPSGGDSFGENISSTDRWIISIITSYCYGLFITGPMITWVMQFKRIWTYDPEQINEEFFFTLYNHFL